MAKTIPGGLTLSASGSPQNAKGEAVTKKDAEAAAKDALSATIPDLDKRAEAIEAKQPVQRTIIVNAPAEAK